MTLSAETAYSGPIPPPALLADYERISPGLALRLIDDAEAESRHRRAYEASIVEAQIAQQRAHNQEARVGQFCAFGIALAALLAGSWTAVQGKEFAGSVLGVSGIGGIVSTFILGRNRIERKQPATPKS